MAFELDPKCALGPELARAVREQLAQAIAKIGRRREPAGERIHFARLACKRARAALKLARSQDKKFYRRENCWLGDAARKLSALRDADAMRESFATLLEEHASAAQRRKLGPVRRVLEAHRRAATPPRADFERRLTRFSQRLEESDQRLADWEPDGDFTALMEDFRRTYKWARLALFAAQALATAEAFHEWRKATKAYAYQCRLLRAAWPSPMKELRDELKELSRRLGEEHDLTLLRRQLRKLRRAGTLDVDEETFQAALGLIESRREKLRQEAIPWGERLFADRPRIVAERMTLWWRVAQAQPEFVGGDTG